MDTLEFLRLKIAGHLCSIERLLPAEYRLTLLARHTTNDDAHIMVSLDEPAVIAAALAQLERGEALAMAAALKGGEAEDAP